MVTWVWRQNYIFDDNNVWKSCLLFPPMKDLCLIKCKCCLGGDKNLNDHCLVSSVSLANWMCWASCRSQLVAKHLIFVGKCKFNIQMSSLAQQCQQWLTSEDLYSGNRLSGVSRRKDITGVEKWPSLWTVVLKPNPPCLLGVGDTDLMMWGRCLGFEKTSPKTSALMFFQTHSQNIAFKQKYYDSIPSREVDQSNIGNEHPVFISISKFCRVAPLRVWVRGG